MELLNVSTASEREITDAFVANFVMPSRRSRWRQLLGSKNGRERLRATLDHNVDFDPKYLQPLEEGSTADDAYYALSSKGAQDIVYAISSDPELDGTRPALAEIIESVVNGDTGTILISDPTKLAFFESEERGLRFLLAK